MIAPLEPKRCSRCKEMKSTLEFAWKRGYCKACNAARMKRYRAKVKSAVPVGRALWRSFKFTKNGNQ